MSQESRHNQFNIYRFKNYMHYYKETTGQNLNIKYTLILNKHSSSMVFHKLQAFDQKQTLQSTSEIMRVRQVRSNDI